MIVVTFTGTNLDKIKLLNFCKSIRNFRVDGPLTNETSVLIAKTGGMSEKYKVRVLEMYEYHIYGHYMLGYLCCTLYIYANPNLNRLP
jgi:hypothetical protein